MFLHFRTKTLVGLMYATVESWSHHRSLAQAPHGTHALYNIVDRIA